MNLKLQEIDAEDGFETLCLLESQVIHTLSSRYINQFEIIKYGNAALDDTEEMNKVIYEYIIPTRAYMVGPNGP